MVASVGLGDRVRRLAPATPVREWRFPSAIVGDHAADAEGLRHRLGLPDDAPVVLYSGTFEAYQGLEHLIVAAPRILQRVPSARFVFVGADKAGRIEVEDAAADLVRDGVLTVVDRQPRWMIPSYLALADVLVSPRALAGTFRSRSSTIWPPAGRSSPPISRPTARCSTSDRAVLVAPTPEGLADGIVSVLCDGANAAALAGAAREYAVEHLGWRQLRAVGRPSSTQEVAPQCPA